MLPVAALLLVQAFSASHAGTLSTGLSGLIANGNPDDTVTVWIELSSIANKTSLSAGANESSISLAAQHRTVIERLQSENLTSQKSLVEALQARDRLTTSGPVKQHWLVNVVEAQVTYAELPALAQRTDVRGIDLPPLIELIHPIGNTSSSAQNPAVPRIPPNLTRIRADVAWGMGYTGVGRVVCSFDNGVDGEHVALKGSWKGRNGDSAAAWFDPLFHSKSPRVTPSITFPNNVHGTHTMGLLVGQVDTLITGVAKDAQWISAAVIDVKGASILDAFEWAADPDGDPNTVGDVPDVISHSWGFSARPSQFGLGCSNVVFDAIDNTENLGIVNIFAAGNDGLFLSGTSISNPANRALDSIDCFAVGALDAQTFPPQRALLSSQGPSDCTGRIKPNIMAPGVFVISSIPGNKYDSLSGTSMATPQVAGLVALMRQKNPNASVRDIKTAILKSANRAGLSGLPNNDYGWGVVDCAAALTALSSTATVPNIRVYAFTHDPIAPGDTVVGTVVLQNLGANGTNVSVTLSSGHPSLQVLAGSAFYGSIARNDTVRSPGLFRIVVSDTVSIGSVLSLPLTISGGGFSTPAALSFLVEPTPSKAISTHSTGRVQFSLSNFGAFGLGNTSIFPAGGAGFSLDGGQNDLWEAGIIVANSPVQIASAVHSLIFQPDVDFVVAPGGSMTFMAPGPIAAQQTHAALADDHAQFSLGLLATQESYTYASPDNDFVIIRYILQNKNNAIVSNLRFGLFFDWDIGAFDRNGGTYSPADGLLWQAENVGTAADPNLRSFRGLTLLDGPLATAIVRKCSIVYTPWIGGGFQGYDGFTAQEKYVNLFGHPDSSVQYRDSLNDLFEIMAAGPLTLAPYGVDTVAFAVVAGSSMPLITSAASRARSKYNQIATDVEEPDPDRLPGEFTLFQNYPNPFNPTTRISFNLPRESDYVVTIHNVLGQTVERMSGHAKAGQIEITWDAHDRATGVYLYRVAAGPWSSSRKMLLLK